MRFLDIPRKVARRARSYVQTAGDRSSIRGLILAYHRVIALKHDPQLLAVTPENFKEQLDVLNREFVPKSLIAISDAKRQSLPLVALTFDDGYADNYQFAKPLLEMANMPATFFVASGFIDGDREFYWDELEQLLLHPAMGHGRLIVRLLSNTLEWNLDEWNDSYDESGWNVTYSNRPSARHEAYVTLCSMLKLQPDAIRQSVLNQIAEFAGVTRHVREQNRSMQPQEIAILGQSPLFEIGAHTVTHPSVPTLSAQNTTSELIGSKEHLEGITGREVTSFAFPYGERSDFNAAAVDAVQAAGFRQSCINCPGLLVSRTSRMMLPRFIVRNWNGEEFSRHLHTWMAQQTAVYL